MNQRGASAIEYAILAAVIGCAIVLGLSLFGQTVRALFEAAAGLFQYLR
jgi:Flp pilus assembly pilin Flp